MPARNNHDLRKEVKRLVGLECWGVVAGVGNGSMATFHLGSQIERRSYLRNPKLSESLRNYQGQYCLFIEGCSWRLSNQNSVICTWRDPEEVIGRQTGRMSGCHVTAARVQSESYDLSVVFDKRYFLELFCDQTRSNDMDNYSLRSPRGWLSVSPGSRLRGGSTRVGK